MKAHDIEFTLNGGPHKGDTYRFTLARVNKPKAWQVTRLYRPAPSMVKERIEMAIACREQNIALSGVTELAQANKILDDLEIISDETTPVTLKGPDNRPREVIMDKGGFALTPTFSESGKEMEYRVNVICWRLFE